VSHLPNARYTDYSYTHTLTGSFPPGRLLIDSRSEHWGAPSPRSRTFVAENFAGQPGYIPRVTVKPDNTGTSG